MQSYLFIGGAHDGKSIPVAANEVEARVPVGLTESELYIRDILGVGNTTIAIFRHETLTPEQTLDRMVVYYSAWVANRPRVQ
jgi:hypothetical protein